MLKLVFPNVRHVTVATCTLGPTSTAPLSWALSLKEITAYHAHLPCEVVCLYLNQSFSIQLSLACSHASLATSHPTNPLRPKTT